MVVGFLSAILWREVFGQEIYELIPAFGIAFISVIVVSLMTQTRQAEQ